MDNYIPTTCSLGIKNHLISYCLDFGLLQEAKQLQSIDDDLFYSLKQNRKSFDFIEYITAGKTLLVGEGNLSFSISLINKHRIQASNLTATTFEASNELSENTSENTTRLRAAGARVLHGVDAQKLTTAFGATQFDNIIFQFPHSGSREPINGHNPNFILVRDFL